MKLEIKAMVRTFYLIAVQINGGFKKKKHDLISLLKRSLCLLNGKGFSGCKNGRRKTPRDRGPGEQKILSEQTHWLCMLKEWATCPAAELGKT